MRKQKRAIGLILLIVIINFLDPCYGYIRSKAASFDEINHPDVFLKQVNGDMQCTLVAATMLLRRAALMSGNANWADITIDKVRKDAWVEGVGLKYSFSHAGFTVNKAQFGNDRVNEAITLLQQHPEGIVVYDQYGRSRPHAVLLTDYTDGVFYCADPSDTVAYGRIPVSQGLVKVEEAEFYYYISSPSVPALTASDFEDGAGSPAVDISPEADIISGANIPGESDMAVADNLPAADALPATDKPSTDIPAATENLQEVDISRYEIELLRTSLYYDGNEKKPAVTVAGLEENTDYILSYINNVNPGTAAIAISGIGNYTGVVIKYFEIVEADIHSLFNDIAVSVTKQSIQAGKTATVKVNLPEPLISVKEFGVDDKGIGNEVKISYSSSNSKIAKVNSKGKITGKKKGKANITVTAELADGTKKEFTLVIKVK